MMTMMRPVKGRGLPIPLCPCFRKLPLFKHVFTTEDFSSLSEHGRHLSSRLTLTCTQSAPLFGLPLLFVLFLEALIRHDSRIY